MAADTRTQGEWTLENGNVLTATITDEGVVFDIWDPNGIDSLFTDGRTAEEWAEVVRNGEMVRWAR